jgi:glycosyltransferase involved in cell wall biosynthesis
MKILVVTPTFLPVVGGAEIVILEIYRRLARRHEVLLVTADKGGLPSDRDHLVNFPVERYADRITTMKLRGHRMTGGLVPPFSLSAVAAVDAAVGRFRPDVVNAHYMTHTGLAAIVAKNRRGVPTVLSLVGRDVPGPRTPYGWKYYCRWAARSATDVIYISDYCRRAVFGENGPARGRVIFAGVDIARFTSRADGSIVRDRYGIDSGAPLLVAVQRVAPEKRVDVIVRAMPPILARHPRAVLLVGGKGAALAAVKSLAARLGIAGSVRFAGYVPDADLPGFYAAADIFVFHSTYETFGVVLAEAMAAGKPIVSVKSTAIPEVVAQGKTGLLVPPLDPEALSREIGGLIESPGERERLGRNAREWAEANLDWNVIAGQYEAVLEQAAGCS